jgi:hypothetical protein
VEKMILKEISESTSQANVINQKNVEEEINMIAGDKGRFYYVEGNFPLTPFLLVNNEIY